MKLLGVIAVLTPFGNPPFIRGKAIGATFGNSYRDYLASANEDSNASADIVAFFFRRSFSMLRQQGTFGLIATKTISKGDTRLAGLRYICTHGGTIFSARKRLKWPGVAAVVVSTVHIIRGSHDSPILDGVPVSKITAFLFTHGGHEDPLPLRANSGISFNGCALAGVGFTFDDDEPRASNTESMREVIARNAKNEERIFPYLGGDEINNSPLHENRRWVIFFAGMSLEEASAWPELLEILREKVKPERDQANRDAHRLKWWQFGDWRPGLFGAIAPLNRMLCVVFVSEHLGFVWLPTDRIVSHNVGVFARQSDNFLCMLQSRVHESFATQLSSGLEDRQGYRPSDGFEPFPFPLDFETDSRLEEIGREYYAFRAALMVRNNEGLTKTYNRFHDPDERSPDILKLRELHAAMDRAVLDAYGWTDLKPTCEFLLDYEEEEDEEESGGGRRRKKPWRYRWPDDFRDEVLARLLELNRQRAEEERLSGAAAEAGRVKVRKKSTAGRKATRKNPDQPEFFES